MSLEIVTLDGKSVLSGILSANQFLLLCDQGSVVSLTESLTDVAIAQNNGGIR